MAHAWRGFGCAECTLSLDSTPPMQSLPRRPAQMPLQAPFREQFSDLEAALYSKTPTHSLYFIEHRRAVPLRLLRRHDLGHYAATLGDDGLQRTLGAGRTYFRACDGALWDAVQGAGRAAVSPHCKRPATPECAQSAPSLRVAV